jgi:16S rRNA (cytosine967-C5)-methyltransferase
MNPPPGLSAQLSWAARGLAAVHSGQSSTEWLGQCPAELRPGVQALLLSGLRQWGLSRALRQLLVPKPPAPATDALLCLSLGLLTQQPPPYAPHTLVSQAVEAAKSQPRLKALAPLINACLRRCLREREALLNQVQNQPEARWNHPRWWVEQLQQDHPDAWQRILTQAHQKPPMVLRINPRRTTKADWLQACRDAGIAVQDLPGQAVCLPHPLPVQRIPGFAAGQCSVQDWAAQMAAPLLLNAMGAAPAGQRWKLLDACAAPGGKTAHLLECADADVLALDVDARRLLRVQDNLKRLGLQARTRAADAAAPETWAEAPEMFDGILLDAPCSASGIVRRHPDIAWLRRPQDLISLARQQKALLDNLWPRLKPGGFLLYCTCSVFKVEGEKQVQAFVAHNTQAIIHPAPGHLVPSAGVNAPAVGDNQVCEPDGFFYALLQKAA